MAAASGLDVPRTVITNVPEDSDSHHEYLGPSVIYKTLASASVTDGHLMSLVYTTDVSRADMADCRVALTAHQFQERVPKVRDVRATVVGSQIFATEIIADASSRGRLDWRADYTSLRYECTHLPPAVETALLLLLRRLGLTFAAADFVVTADDRYYFVDLNPAGQWGWIEAATGLPIAAAIADLLTEGETEWPTSDLMTRPSIKPTNCPAPAPASVRVPVSPATEFRRRHNRWNRCGTTGSLAARGLPQRFPTDRFRCR
ncbi:hypothetical protein [Lentzea tibetensis]|uniref:hypothetical protein n=1 Tax=Lentzea tibetensis TaxID=2591470 RepID=UPI001F30E13B|nr:hypothetical protein [Lentzea tibetensis]